jgi:hypothetical protein
MASFNRALLRVKSDLSILLPETAIVEACREAGHRWRKRLLDPTLTVQLFVLQILWFNTALTHLRHLASYKVKPSAFCQARGRLPVAVMQKLLRTMCETAGTTGLFHGHKLWITDESSSSLADTASLQEAFPQPTSNGRVVGFHG